MINDKKNKQNGHCPHPHWAYALVRDTDSEANTVKCDEYYEKRILDLMVSLFQGHVMYSHFLKWDQGILFGEIPLTWANS